MTASIYKTQLGADFKPRKKLPSQQNPVERLESNKLLCRNVRNNTLEEAAKICEEHGYQVLASTLRHRMVIK